MPPGSELERRTIIADELAEDWVELRSPMEFDFWETEPAKTEKGTDSFNVNVVATSRQWISQVWRDCQRSGLDCWAIDGVPLMMARSVGLVGGFPAAGAHWPLTGDTRIRRCASPVTIGRFTAGGCTSVRSDAFWKQS